MNTDPLAQLRDINLPDSVPYWPPAPGWLILTALVSIMLIALAAWWTWRRSRLPKQPAYPGLQKAYEALAPNYQQHRNLARLLEDTMKLAKAIAMARFGRENIASLSGEQWLRFLTEHYRTFSPKDEQRTLIADGLYRVANTNELSEKVILELKVDLLTTMLSDLASYESDPSIDHRQGVKHV